MLQHSITACFSSSTLAYMFYFYNLSALRAPKHFQRDLNQLTQLPRVEKLYLKPAYIPDKWVQCEWSVHCAGSQKFLRGGHEQTKG